MMTREQALALHNPFQHGSSYEIDCQSQPLNSSLLRERESVCLIFPKQEWIDLVAETPSIKAVFVDRPRTRNLNLNPLSKLELYNFSTSYPGHVTDWSFLGKIPSLRRVVLNNTLSIQNLHPLEQLSNLEVLILSGGYSSVLRLPSLSPISKLKKLKAMFLASVRFKSWNLDSVIALPDLACFDAPLYCPKEEAAKLARRIPKPISNLFDS